MKKHSDKLNLRNIVILRTDRIGEVLLSTPVIEALKRNFPSAKISFVTSLYSSDIVSDRPDLDAVILFDTIKRVPLWKAVSLASKLRKKRFDAAFILNPHRILHLAVFLAAIPYRVGFDRKWGFLLTHKAKDRRCEGKRHEVIYNLKLLEAIGISQDSAPLPFINVTGRNSYCIRGLFEQFGITSDKKTIAIHPGSSNPAKRWPAEDFAELIKKLVAWGNIKVMLVGDRSEKALCGKIASCVNSKELLDLSGLFTIKQLAAFFKAVNLLITNDNGPMHIAAAVGCRVIAIFGPASNPTRWGPYSEGHQVIAKASISDITPEEIFAAAKEIVQ